MTINDSLEKMIDSKGLSGVLSLMADICFEKAEHVEYAWQDSKLANAWEKIGSKINGYSITVKKQGF